MADSIRPEAEHELISTEGFVIAGEVFFSPEDRTVRIKMFPTDSVIGIKQLGEIIGPEPVLSMFSSVHFIKGEAGRKDEVDIALTLP